MPLLACLLLAAAPTSIELLDESPVIAAHKWNYYAVNLRQQTARVDAWYAVQSPKGQVKLALLTYTDLDRLFQNVPHGVLAATPAARAGSLRCRVPRTGDYAVVVDNRDGESDVKVHVRVSLEFGGGGPEVTSASPARRLTVVALSAMFFLTVATYSARRILRAVRGGE